jgi:drug/metabolite transporter (DMT)-like permease
MNKGYFSAFIAVWLWGLSYAASQKVVEHISPTQLILLSSLFNLIITAPIFLRNKIIIPELSILKWLILVEISSFAASYFIYQSIRELGATRATIFEIGYPLTTTLFCVLLFGEKLDWRLLVGGVLIFAGSLIVSLGK